MLFFWNFLLRIGQERNGTIIFILSLSQPLPTYFGLKWGSNGIFLISLIFLLFCFVIFYYTSGRNGTERNDNFYFLSFPAISSLLWLKMKPQWYFLIFWIFLLFFWNFLLHIGQEWNGTIIFILSLSQPLLTYFCLKWSHNGIFLIFLIILLFFWEFFVMCRIGT